VSICEEQAALSSFCRHADQAIALVMQPSQPKLTVLRGEGDDLTAPSASHPASRALRRQEDS
jgi:hypothetical protein